MRVKSVSLLGLQRVVLLILGLFGCAPGIGDECVTSNDCSQSGERQCDVTQRDGYCTVFNCEPNSCPDESVCIVFGAAVSPLPACADASRLSRVHRSSCMASCESNDDCRTGYVCTDLGRKDNPWGAIVAGRGSGKVCIKPLLAKPVPSSRPAEFCEPVISAPEGAGGTGSENGALDGSG